MDKLTAAMVKLQPVGTRIIIHGRDRRGWPTELHCTLVQRQRSKALAFRWPDGTRDIQSIRELDGKSWYYTLGGYGCGIV